MTASDNPKRILCRLSALRDILLLMLLIIAILAWVKIFSEAPEMCELMLGADYIKWEPLLSAYLHTIMALCSILSLFVGFAITWFLSRFMKVKCTNDSEARKGDVRAM